VQTAGERVARRGEKLLGERAGQRVGGGHRGFMIAAFLITMGTLGDRIGRRRLLMIGGTAFAPSSARVAMSISALEEYAASTDQPELIAERQKPQSSGCSGRPSSANNRVSRNDVMATT